MRVDPGGLEPAWNQPPHRVRLDAKRKYAGHAEVRATGISVMTTPPSHFLHRVRGGDGHSMGETGLKAVSQAVQYLLGKPAVTLPTLRTPDPALGAAAEQFILQRRPVRGREDSGAICATQGFGGYDGVVALKPANTEAFSRYEVDPKVLADYLERWPQVRREREERERKWRRRRGAALELAQLHRWQGLQ